MKKIAIVHPRKTTSSKRMKSKNKKSLNLQTILSELSPKSNKFLKDGTSELIKVPERPTQTCITDG